MKKKITFGNIWSFIQGTSRAYYDKLIGLPGHLQEQVTWRLSQCDDCIADGACQVCACPPLKKAFATKTCNVHRFPDLMEKQEWEQYKRVRGIAINEEK
jgi:hypothetical protein